ncbi:hypothetical protein VMUT_0732 [Vulcanisaeta moutnovskia 768-28]|uniref:Uncharacterized protein n=1 Tax=Vulcanisaeta moutnovskia (strain 768-28) TaxID=985053 RepID=F0QW19_VULM7|nr:hypothetical protein [Vulcanisaeta moutnovskia]ADY00943.1 hypothetical protein VMUT_0732 [Vulcanisaeta moutnovskia 768-28]
MIYKSLLPILIVLLVMIVLTTYLMNYVNNETSRALTLENNYLLSTNVFKQLNNTLPQILRNNACMLIANPMNYSCSIIAMNMTNMLSEALNIISNKTGNIARYRVINYEIYGEGNVTIYQITIQALIQSNSIEGTITTVYPFNLCYYSQLVNNIVNDLRENITIHADNITETSEGLSKELMSKINHNYDNINITLHYTGVFSMTQRTRNYTIYVGIIDYTLYVSPSEKLCSEFAKITGSFYVTIIINKYVNNTYYFTINGIISNNK